MIFKKRIFLKTKPLTPHQIRKVEFETIRKKIIELDFQIGLASLYAKPTIAEAPLFAVHAACQELAVRAAKNLWQLAEHLQDHDGHRFSYRNFLVIASAYGLRLNGGRRWKWFVRTSTNTKWQAGKYRKHCAEMRVMASMQKHSAIMLGMVVMGVPQPDDITRTLHPCDVCRHLMRDKYKTIFRPWSRIILVNPNATMREGYSMSELMDMHHEHF